jgi:hypothetical protein
MFSPVLVQSGAKLFPNLNHPRTLGSISISKREGQTELSQFVFCLVERDNDFTGRVNQLDAAQLNGPSKSPSRHRN